MKYIPFLKKWIHELSRYQIGIYAANASFYIILSTFPMIMLITALLPVFGINGEEILSGFEGLIPDLLYPLFKKILEDLNGNHKGVLLSATAPVAIWSASGGIYCIRQGFNAICHSGVKASFLKMRLSSMLYTIILILSLVLTLVINGFGRDLVSYMTNQTIPIIKLLGAILRMRGVILMVILTGLFTGMYCIFPSKKQSLRTVLPGAASGALGWLLFTEGYSLYVHFSGSYSLLYGSLSIIAMGMVWLYGCISILFYGFLLNIYMEKDRKRRTA